MPEIEVSFSDADAYGSRGLPPSPPQPEDGTETAPEEIKRPIRPGPLSGTGTTWKRRLGGKTGSDTCGGEIGGQSPAPDPVARKLQPHATALLTQTANPGTWRSPSSSTGDGERGRPGGHKPGWAALKTPAGFSQEPGKTQGVLFMNLHVLLKSTLRGIKAQSCFSSLAYPDTPIIPCRKREERC